MKKSTRTRNLQKYPVLKDISKSIEPENDSDNKDEQVQLRSKSPTSNTARHQASKQMNALVSVGLMELITINSN